MKLQLIILSFFFLSISLFSQESIRVISYNLLNFNNYTSYCTEANNSHIEKVKYLRTIIENQKPDIFAACELGKSKGGAEYTFNYILENALNVNNETKWQASMPLGKGSSLNALFYDKTKFKLIGQPLITSKPRDINVYKLQYLASAEPLYFNIIVVHLKAGNKDDDKKKRSSSASEIMSYINKVENNNYIITGDFNVYTSEEECFQKLIYPPTASNAFNDPINQIGGWHENYNYKDYHTQSTHSGYSPSGSCFVGGGLDDRFDFILISNSIKNGTQEIKYKEDSYIAVGQDGKRFNESINNPTNFSLPQNVINALANMSDHLPVVADFDFMLSQAISTESTDPKFYANITNPISENFAFELKMEEPKELSVNIFNISGLKVLEINEEFLPNTIYEYNTSNLSNGMYIINFNGEGILQSFRVVKN